MRVMNSWKKWLEVITNIAVLCVCVLIAFIGIRDFLSPNTRAVLSGPSKGTHVSLPGVDWSRANRTLVMVLSTQCHFCSDSAAFYQKLLPAAITRNIPVVAVLPQSIPESRQYLTGLGLQTSNISVLQEPMAAVHVSGTPTLFVVNNHGLVQRAWSGKLQAPGEAEVLNEIH
jgi:hypothetical protein